MSDQASIDSGFEETVAHVLRLNEKRNRLEAQIRESLAVAASLAGEFGCNLSDPIMLADAVVAVRAHEVVGRGVLTGGVPNYWINRLCKWQVGTSLVIERADPRLWPGQHLWCCYVLAGAAGEIIYVGKTGNLRSRIKAHSPKPWVTATVIICASEAEALRLEGDLIYHHQPPLNTSDRRNRRFVRVAP